MCICVSVYFLLRKKYIILTIYNLYLMSDEFERLDNLNFHKGSVITK